MSDFARRTAIAAAGALALAACSYTPPPVPLEGVPGDVSALIGAWEGEYSSRDTGRSGYIAFSLVEVGDTARGDVLMLPPGEPRPEWRRDRDGGIVLTAPTRGRSQLLTIAFVRAQAGRVAGALSPYRDPACGCLLETRFYGTVARDSVYGTFDSHHVDTGANARGTWVVHRRPPAPSP